MCRLFGQLSLMPRDAADLLAESPRSLLAQSDARASDPQKDGWGIAYFGGRRRRVLKSPRPVFREAGRFASAAARARSRAVIGHIRAASNPRGVVPRRLISLANTQPFSDGTWAFCHNGTLQIPDEVARFLGPYRSRLRGINDSEVFFWQLRKHIDAQGDPAEALKACVREIWGIWEGCKRRYPNKRSPYTGLNALVSDGKSLYALCHYPWRPKHKALMSSQPWGVMSLARRGGRVVIASEDMDGGRWDRLGPAEVVSVTTRNGKLALRREGFDPRELA
jgi:predicted glutamine amidotransferase